MEDFLSFLSLKFNIVSVKPKVEISYEVCSIERKKKKKKKKKNLIFNYFFFIYNLIKKKKIIFFKKTLHGILIFSHFFINSI